MRIIDANIKHLDMLYKGSALTLEGLIKEDVPLWIGWLKENGYVNNDEDLTAYNISGELMNSHYNLVEERQYQNDLNIVCIALKDLVNVEKLAISPARFQMGFRWFDNIVDNNRLSYNSDDEDDEY